MFFDIWDVRLEISVVSTHLNLNGLSVHMKNRKMEKSVSTLVLIGSRSSADPEGGTWGPDPPGKLYGFL